MTASGQYLGTLRTELTHIQSGTQILTDAPTDNHGKGEAFSPTDLVAAALGSCAITTMAIEAKKQGFDPEGLTWTMLKKMAGPPRRIAGIDIMLTWEGGPPASADIERLKQAALTCPVALSLHPDLVQHIQFSF
jgi:uncharacterized OsmC-like protein